MTLNGTESHSPRSFLHSFARTGGVLVCNIYYRDRIDNHIYKRRFKLRALEPPQRLFHFARNGSTASCVNDVTDFKAIELARRTDGIRPHVVESEPITDAQRVRQLCRGAHAIQGITGWSPDAAGYQRFRGKYVE